MKSLLLAIMLVAGVANAQLVPGNGDGHGPGSGNHGHHGGHGGGGIVPGNGDGHGPGSGNHGHEPGNPYEPGYPSNPYEPGYPSYPGYSDYGPAYTYRWQDMGSVKVDKFLTQSFRYNAGNQLVNEVLLRSTEGDTQVVRAYATLSSGRVINLQTGVVRQGSDVRLRLDYQYSLRIQSIEIQATSQNLIGSRARLQVWLGLAQ